MVNLMTEEEVEAEDVVETKIIKENSKIPSLQEESIQEEEGKIINLSLRQARVITKTRENSLLHQEAVIEGEFSTEGGVVDPKTSTTSRRIKESMSRSKGKQNRTS